MATNFANIDEYLTSFPPPVREVLSHIRRRIHAAVPGSGEAISYGIPTVTLDGTYLVYFAGWKSHVSVYPVPDVDGALAREIEPYRSGKGTLKFPLNRPVPYDLIDQIVARLVAQRG